MTSRGGMLLPLTADLALAYERAFMERLTERIESAESFGKGPDGRTLKGTARLDGDLSRDFRAEVERRLRSENFFDSVVLERLPKGVRMVWAVRSGTLLARRTVMTISAAVTHPYRELALGLSPAPLPSEQAADWLPATAPAKGGALGVVLSTSGWRHGGDDPSVILFEPAPGGGFMARGRECGDLPGFLALASEEELVQRVLEYVERERVRLVMDGIELAEAGAATGVPESLVQRAFVAAATEGEFLRVAEEGGTLVLRRA